MYARSGAAQSPAKDELSTGSPHLRPRSALVGMLLLGSEGPDRHPAARQYQRHRCVDTTAWYRLQPIRVGMHQFRDKRTLAARNIGANRSLPSACYGCRPSGLELIQQVRRRSCGGLEAAVVGEGQDRGEVSDEGSSD